MGNFALVASLNLSAAFDFMNVEILLKRLKIIGLPRDMVDLIRIWLREITFYVTAKGHNSFITNLPKRQTKDK